MRLRATVALMLLDSCQSSDHSLDSRTANKGAVRHDGRFVKRRPPGFRGASACSVRCPNSTAAATLRSIPSAKNSWISSGARARQLADAAVEARRTPRGRRPGRRDPRTPRRPGAGRGGACRSSRSVACTPGPIASRTLSQLRGLARHVAPGRVLEGEAGPAEAAPDDGAGTAPSSCRTAGRRTAGRRRPRWAIASVEAPTRPPVANSSMRGRDDRVATLVGGHAAGASVLGPPRGLGGRWHGYNLVSTKSPVKVRRCRLRPAPRCRSTPSTVTRMPGPQAGGGVAAADDGGNAVLARDDRCMGRGAADVGDDRRRAREQRRPRRRGERRDEDLARLQLVEVVPATDDADEPGHAAGRCRDAADDRRPSDRRRRQAAGTIPEARRPASAS